MTDHRPASTSNLNTTPSRRLNSSYSQRSQYCTSWRPAQSPFSSSWGRSVSVSRRYVHIRHLRQREGAPSRSLTSWRLQFIRRKDVYGVSRMLTSSRAYQQPSQPSPSPPSSRSPPRSTPGRPSHTSPPSRSTIPRTYGISRPSRSSRHISCHRDGSAILICCTPPYLLSYRDLASIMLCRGNRASTSKERH